MAGKLSKQELKEPDKFQVMLSQVMMYLAENKQKLYIAGGVLAMVLVIAGGWYLYDLNMEKSAQQSYARVYDAAAGEGEAAVGIYKDVVAKYPGSRAAALANYRLGNLYYRQNDFDGAVKSYEAFLQRTPDKSDLKTLAYMGLLTVMKQKKTSRMPLPLLKKRQPAKPDRSLKA
jgi:predicted negative regulator of RcsB-dependent stress response